MSRKIFFLFTILFIISAIAAPVYANQTVFGPKDLKIGRWDVHLSLHQFTVDDPSDGVLNITKNTPDKKIRGGFCFLNGKYIGLRNFLKGTGLFFEKDVNLRSNNRLTVFLRGTPGALIKIEIKKKDVTPPPEVTFAAAPQTITPGESSILSWSSTDADTCVIEHGIGSVGLSGSLQVSPTETTTYTITVTGSGGTATDNVTVTVIPLSISITSPINEETISMPDVMVKGTITNAGGIETGVTVNGTVAIVSGNQFAVNHVPLEEGINTITATATDTDGNTAEASINVNALTPSDYIKITADDDLGISPLETTLEIDGSFSFTESSISYTGPGVVEFLDSPNDNKYNVKITTPGIYYFTAEVTDDHSNIYTDTIAIQVLDEAALDALLTAKWEGMRTALSQNDIDGAVSYFDISTQDAYKTFFIANPQLLTQMAQKLDDIQFIAVMKHSVEYDIRAIVNETEYSFYLLFIKNDQGLWKIKSF